MERSAWFAPINATRHAHLSAHPPSPRQHQDRAHEDRRTLPLRPDQLWGGDPNAVIICHRIDCQTLTASAFRANISAGRAFRVPQRYAKELHEDRRKRQQTPPRLLWRLRHYHLRLRRGQSAELLAAGGDDPLRSAFSPERRAWRRSALGWVGAAGAVPATELRSPKSAAAASRLNRRRV